MTRKIYKSAMGKTVDMGSLLLQNERTRAVGNMNVNARGDRLDSNNKIVESKNQQVQRRYNKQTNVSAGPAHSGTLSVKNPEQQQMVDPNDNFSDLLLDDLESQAQQSSVSLTRPRVEPVTEPKVEPVTEPKVEPVTGPKVEPVTEPKVESPAPVDTGAIRPSIPSGGLASAIARSREVKQELEKTRRQQAQAQGVRKI
jgi:hypothetical protein